MKAKELLSKMLYLNGMVDHQVKEIYKLKEYMTVVSSVDVSKDRVTGGKLDSKIEDAICRLTELEALLGETLNQEMEIKVAVHTCMGALEDEGEKAVIQMRYVDGLEWAIIANKLETSLKKAQEIHHSALESFQRTLDAVCA